MSIWLQKSASIQKRTSPLKFDNLAEKSEISFDIEPLSTLRPGPQAAQAGAQSALSVRVGKVGAPSEGRRPVGAG